MFIVLVAIVFVAVVSLDNSRQRIDVIAAAAVVMFVE